MEEHLFAALAIVLGAVWTWSGASKLYSPPATTGIRRLGVPDRLAGTIIRGLPLVEIAIGAMLLARLHVRETAAASASLLALFGALKTAAFLRSSLAGQALEGDCGCFGRRRPRQAPARNRPMEETPFVDNGRAARDIAITLALALVSLTLAAQDGTARCRCDGLFF